jgi:YHS domain-containing protein
MFVTMATAALIIDGLFSLLGLVPTARPTRADIFQTIQVDYKLALNAVALAVFVALFALTMRRGATDPVCHMTVDRSKSLSLTVDGTTYHFCSAGCRDTFQSQPELTETTRTARSSH